MKYFFVLGNHPALSIVELSARLTILKSEYFAPDIFVVEVSDLIDGEAFLATIGGVIKMGEIITVMDNKPHQVFTGSLEILREAPKSGKFNFGLSSYGRPRLDGKRVGLALKQALKNEDVSCRFVTSKEKTLSSVVVEQNKLVRSGREIVYIGNGKEVLIGITKAVQPFKRLSERDYGRPARDDRSGMLPPKLAQIMINCAKINSDEILLDPFCGSGTIITEALLMNYRIINGSDISAKAISDSEENVKWLKEQYTIDTVPHLKVLDARRLSSAYKSETVAGIVTETYLGPQRGAVDLKKISIELSLLYNQVLQEMYSILKKGGRAVIALPAFMRNGEPQLLKINFGAFKKVNSIPSSIKIYSGITSRDSFLYGRADQKVWREIIILEK
jgi:tRNA G10  N-methylase Trm11